MVVAVGDTVKLAVGGAGGPNIISGTLQVLLNVVDGKLNAQAASVGEGATAAAGLAIAERGRNICCSE